VPLFGPRLDRPSAIGDEGRSRAASLTVASLVVVGFALAVAWQVSLGSTLRTVAVGLGFVGFGLGLFDRDSFARLAFAHVCFLPGGVLVLGGVATVLAHPIARLRVPLLVLSFGLAVAGIGLVGGWTDAVGDRGLTTATLQGWAGVFVPLVLLVVVGIVGVVGWLGWAALVEPALFPADGPVLSGLFFAVAVGAIGLSVALWRLPLVQLAPRDRRTTVSKLRSRGLLAVGMVAAGSTVGWIAVALLEATGVMADLYRTVPLLEPLLSLTATPLVRVPAVVVGIAAVVAVVFGGLLRLATSDLSDGFARAIAPMVSVLGLLGIPVPLLVGLLFRITTSPPEEAVGWLLVGLGAFVAITFVAGLFMLVFTLGPLVGWLGLLPERAGPGALAGFGLLVASAGAAVASLPAWLVFAGVAGAVVVWDAAEFGAGLTVELGHLPATRRIELLHAVGSLAVGVAAVAIVVVLDWLLGALVTVSTPAPGAVVLAVTGVLALLVPLRG
jgi:hypothetical protein